MECFQISEDLARLGLLKLEGGRFQGLRVEGRWEGNVSACIKPTASSFLLSQLPHCWPFLEVYPSIILFVCICVHMYICTCECECPQKAEKGIISLGSGLTGS